MALGIDPQQLDPIARRQPLVDAQNAPALVELVVKDRAGSLGVQPPIGGLRHRGADDAERSGAARDVGLLLDVAVGPIGELRLALKRPVRVAGLEVDDARHVLAVLGRQSAHDDLGLLDDLRIEKLLQPVLDGRRKLDSVHPQLEPREVSPHMDGAVVVRDRAWLGLDDVVELAGRATRNVLDVLPRDDGRAGGILRRQRGARRLNGGVIRTAALSFEGQHQVVHGGRHIEGLGARDIALGLDFEGVVPERDVGNPKPADLIGVGALDGNSTAGPLGIENQPGLGDRLAVWPPNLALDLGAPLGRGMGDRRRLRDGKTCRARERKDKRAWQMAKAPHPSAASRRNSSPSDQAWKGQPLGVCGRSPSAISKRWPPAPAAASRRGARNRSRASFFTLGDPPRTRTQASTNGPMSQGHTVPW